MPWYEEVKINARQMEQNQIFLSDKKPSLPLRTDDIMVFVEGRLLGHEIQWSKQGPREINCLPIKPGQQWHVRWWHDKPQVSEAMNYTIPGEHMDKSAIEDPNIQRILNSEKPDGGYRAPQQGRRSP